MIESLRTKWSYLRRCLQRNYNLTIPTIHIYNGQQSGIKTWICFGVFPVNHSPYDQVILNVACPSSIYILIRKNASYYNLASSTSSNETLQHACDPDVPLFLIFIFVLTFLTTITCKLKPKTCKGINTNHEALLDLFKREPILCLQKWHYLRGFRNKSCPFFMFGKENTCKHCI